jgi:NTP pyrophosphatase (non-canonical NTP hydrolase)
LNLDIIQDEVALWRKYNFPNSGADHQFLGIVEEVGEAAHAILKMQQGIRDSDVDDLQDAVGDIMIYLLNFCDCMGWSLKDIIETTWGSVRKRDWQNNRENGEVEDEEGCNAEVPETGLSQGHEPLCEAWGEMEHLCGGRRRCSCDGS